jgi:hypothetical protein
LVATRASAVRLNTGGRGLHRDVRGHARSPAQGLHAGSGPPAAANFYAWDTEEAARGLFSEELRDLVMKLYAVAPDIEFVEIAALVDNARD